VKRIKSKSAILILLISLIGTYFTPSITVSAAPALPAVLRVGLESYWRNVPSVPIDSPSLNIGYALAGNGDFQSGVSAVISRQSSFAAVPAGGSFVRKSSAMGYDDAAAIAFSLASSGYSAAPALDSDGAWAVYAYGYASDDAAQADADNTGGTFLPGNGRRVMLMDGSACAVIFENSSGFCRVADAQQGKTALGDRSYRGAIELMRDASGLTAVNVVSFQDYLKSVVPSEIPSGWSAEALKAQAVACRNYALDRMGIHSDEGYDLCDLSHCQNYLGAGNEAASTSAAVDATDGYLIYYDGAPINAVYFSSSGGVTDDSENVWSDAVPYLRSVADPYEYDPKVWTRSFTFAELTSAASANGMTIGAVTGVSVTMEPSGRVGSMTITGTNGSQTLTKEAIRTFFSQTPGGSLESRNFTIQDGATSGAAANIYVLSGSSSSPQPASLPGLYAIGAGGVTQQLGSASIMDGNGNVTAVGAPSGVVSSGGGVTFAGRGWGHGVGMSQHGAEGLAEMGYNFIQILQFYYTGVTVTNG